MIRTLVFLGCLAYSTPYARAGCGGHETIKLYKGDSQIIQTPTTDSNYCKKEWHVDLIRGKNDISQWRIDVEVVDMNLDCDTASVTVLEDVDIPKTYKYCGNNKRTFYSHEHDLHLTYVNKAASYGNVTLKVSAEYLCGGRFTEDNGHFTSPFFPNPYPSDISCIYQLSAPHGKKPLVTCPEFNLNTKCKKKCSAGSGERDYMLDMLTFESYEGKELQGKSIKSSRFHETLYFVSNDYNLPSGTQGYGFNCTYKFV